MRLPISLPWLRSIDPALFNGLAEKAGDSTQTDAEAAQWLAYSQLVDWQELCARSFAFKQDRWVAYWRAKREAALVEAETAWKNELEAFRRYERRTQEPD